LVSRIKGAVPVEIEEIIKRVEGIQKGVQSSVQSGIHCGRCPKWNSLLTRDGS